MTKPLPLKQRTSSLDTRRDYSTQTWWSVLGLLKFKEYFITVDHSSIWRRHLAWAMKDGKDLKTYMTQRYASSMVFMSLLLSAELSVLFNSAGIIADMRHQLQVENYHSISFWIGVTIIISAILTLISLLSTFTAWTMVSAVDEANAHCVFRSSIGQYVAELPGTFIVYAIYSFIAWVVMWIFVLIPFGWFSCTLIFFALLLFLQTVTAFSAFGRVIMHSGAMGSQRIFDPSYERLLMPHSLHQQLLAKAKANLVNNFSITRQYRGDTKPLDRHYSDEELTDHLSDRTLMSADSSVNGTPDSVSTAKPTHRKRADSSVRFADQIFTEQLGEESFQRPATDWPRLAQSSEKTSGGSKVMRGSLLRESSYKKGKGRISPVPTNSAYGSEEKRHQVLDKISTPSEEGATQPSEHGHPKRTLLRSSSKSQVFSSTESDATGSNLGGQDLSYPPKPGLMSSKNKTPVVAGTASGYSPAEMDGIQKWLQASPLPNQETFSAWATAPHSTTSTERAKTFPPIPQLDKSERRATSQRPPLQRNEYSGVGKVLHRTSPAGIVDEAINAVNEKLRFDIDYGDPSDSPKISNVFDLENINENYIGRRNGSDKHFRHAKGSEAIVNDADESASLLAHGHLKNGSYLSLQKDRPGILENV